MGLDRESLLPPFLRQAGAFTLAEDETSAVVFGMPREAIARGAVAEVLPLDRLPAALARAAQGDLPDLL